MTQPPTTSHLQTRIDALTPKQRLALDLLLNQDQQPASTAVRKKLCAYIVRADGKSVDHNEIRGWLRERLPDYMVPEFLVEVDALPRTANGKLDTKRLPLLPVTTPSATFNTDTNFSNNEITPPRNDDERTLAKIWADLLGLEVINVHDDFFEVGGDSIVSIQVMSRARQAGILLEPRHFKETPTLAGLAEAGSKIREFNSVLNERKQEHESEYDHEHNTNGVTGAPSESRFIFRLDGLGNTIQYFEVESTGDSVPTIHSAQTIRFDQKYFRDTTLQEIAADYIAVIRKVQPNGPYMFVSMDCGAHVTYETAQQILRMGEDVSFFAVVESAPPLLARSVARKYLTKGLRYIRRGNLKGLIQGLKLTARRRSILRSTPASEPASHLFNHGLTINNYLPEIYPGKITVFQSSIFHEQKHGDANIRLWNALTRDPVDVHIVPVQFPFDVFAADYVKDLASCLPRQMTAQTEAPA